MTAYTVETLVHLNIDVTVEAPTENDATAVAAEQAREQYPDAVLVDPIDVRLAVDPLARRITAEDRERVKRESGLEISDEVETLREAIAALCTIGYGGHFDESLPDEERALTWLAHTDTETAAIVSAREHLAEVLRGAMFAAQAGWEAGS